MSVYVAGNVMCTVRNNGDSRSVDQSSEWQPFLNLLKQPLNEATQRSNISVPFAHMDRRQGTWAFDSPPHGNHQTVGRWLAPPKDYSPLGFSTSVPGNLAELEGATSASVPDTTDISPAEAWKPATSELYFLGPPPFFANATLSPRLPLFISRFPPVLALSSWRKHAQHERSGYVSFAAKSFARWWRNSFYGSQSFWLFLYFSFNLLLTLSNKSVMTTFPFPYSLTAIHALCSSFGGYILRRRGLYNPRRLNIRDELVLAAFSVLYSVNVAVSNVSLHLVTVPFHQVVRAATPIFTLFLSSLLLGKRTNTYKHITLVPVIIGVGVATYGDYYFTWWGFCLTMLGTFLASLKTIYTNVLQSSGTPSVLRKDEGSHYRSIFASSQSFQTSWLSIRRRNILPPSLNLHPLDLLTRMSPMAFIQCVIYAQLSGELSRLQRLSMSPLVSADNSHQGYINTRPQNSTLLGCPDLGPSDSRGVETSQLLVLLINGCVAFGLNVVSFTANGKVGSLSMTVAANVKQVLTILFAVSLFGLQITPTNAMGISITLAGGAWYAWAEYTSKRAPALATSQ
ncbi:hypothetical protein NLI96_g12929 [Meripilus lineatus]|uniref:Sugar phosphate transporter domain-containing protein n=1 Tax=Meripilus lineatus TaxID=2056292 RepID=A0AAD5UQR1_9APHY|nr:hypothetical protein NLI96_g12929 [Physisporinus lineatus]